MQLPLRPSILADGTLAFFSWVQTHAFDERLNPYTLYNRINLPITRNRQGRTEQKRFDNIDRLSKENMNFCLLAAS